MATLKSKVQLLDDQIIQLRRDYNSLDKNLTESILKLDKKVLENELWLQQISNLLCKIEVCISKLDGVKVNANGIEYDPMGGLAKK